MGLADYDSCRELGLALAAAIQGPGTLIVASSDLSHYHPYEDAVRMDRNTLRAIQEFDYLSLSRNIDLRVWEACGGAPIVAAMIAAERLGARRATLLAYANSGDTSGDRRQVVGYGAVALHSGGSPAAEAETSFSLNADEREELLRVARASVESVVRTGRRLPDPAAKSEALAQDRGAFVTLRKNGELRGGIGYVAPTKPLVLTVRDVATMAAVEDSRFRPVAAPELPLIDYEVSVISPMRRVLDVNEIVVGRHGLLVRRNGREGLLLPQVPLEEGWNRTGFLENACLKAGLPKDAWKDARTDIFSFTALVFAETQAAAASPAISVR
jgi:AmmeMemoRadiSam system protein A